MRAGRHINAPGTTIAGKPMIKLLLVFLTGLLMSFSAFAESLFKDNPPIGTVMVQQIETPHGQVMLPKGNWTLAGVKTFDADGPYPLGKAVLARIGQDHTLDGLIFLTVSLNDGADYHPGTEKWCARNSDARFFRAIAPSAPSETGCLVLEELVSRFDNLTPPHFKQASSYLADRKIVHPDTMFFATFQIARDHQFLSVSYGFDFRLPPTEMLPGYAPSNDTRYDGPYSDLTRQSNFDLVVDWAQATKTEIHRAFVNR